MRNKKKQQQQAAQNRQAGKIGQQAAANRRNIESSSYIFDPIIAMGQVSMGSLADGIAKWNKASSSSHANAAQSDASLASLGSAASMNDD